MPKGFKAAGGGKISFTVNADNIGLTARADLARALAGDDTVRAGDGNDTVYGDAGNDDLFGDAGNDLLFGGDGFDDLFGGVGNDTLWGGAEDDVLSGGAGTNQIDGGAGAADAVSYQWYAIRDQPLYIDLSSGYAVDRSGFEAGAPPPPGSGQTFSDALSGIENVYGSDATSNVVIGNAVANALYGAGLADHLDGRAGNDEINGGAGNDTIIGGGGVDRMTGGDGNDVFVFRKDDLSSVGFETADPNLIDVVYGFDRKGGGLPDPNGTRDTLVLEGAQSITIESGPAAGSTFLSILYPDGQYRYLTLLDLPNSGDQIDYTFDPFTL
jgi:Ca2+-binding RTX toxin-like protein